MHNCRRAVLRQRSTAHGWARTGSSHACRQGQLSSHSTLQVGGTLPAAPSRPPLGVETTRCQSLRDPSTCSCWCRATGAEGADSLWRVSAATTTVLPACLPLALSAGFVPRAKSTLRPCRVIGATLHTHPWQFWVFGGGGEDEDGLEEQSGGGGRGSAVGNGGALHAWRDMDLLPGGGGGGGDMPEPQRRGPPRKWLVVPMSWNILGQHGPEGLITSDCDAMRIHEPQMALITSECVPFRSCTAHASRPQLWSGFAACCGGTGARSQPHRLSW